MKNAEKSVLGLLDFNFFWRGGGHVSRPPNGLRT